MTALVVLQVLELFVIAPLGTRLHIPFTLQFAVGAAIVAVVLVLVARSRLALAAIVVGSGVELIATLLRFLHPSAGNETLDFAAALIVLVALTVVLSYAVFGPGRVTVHHILGAISIYLNVALVFALAYRLVAALDPDGWNVHAGPTLHDVATFVYFSFTTLTTSGYGDIVPVDAFARSLANLESVIGQLFPATLLARLISLEIATARSGREGE